VGGGGEAGANEPVRARVRSFDDSRSALAVYVIDIEVIIAGSPSLSYPLPAQMRKLGGEGGGDKGARPLVVRSARSRSGRARGEPSREIKGAEWKARALPLAPLPPAGIRAEGGTPGGTAVRKQGSPRAGGEREMAGERKNRASQER